MPKHSENLRDKILEQMFLFLSFDMVNTELLMFVRFLKNKVCIMDHSHGVALFFSVS